jgi:hypothetical protein
MVPQVASAIRSLTRAASSIGWAYFDIELLLAIKKCAGLL